MTRPTSARLRETVFDICQQDVAGARCLDLFAGSGAMGLEALSRGAKSCIFVDNSKASIVAIKRNVQALGFESCCQVIFNDVFAFLNPLKHKAQFDLIFVDPPYEKEGCFDQRNLSYSDKVIQMIDGFAMLAPGGSLFIEDVHKKSAPSLALSTLVLVSSRRSGRATLNQFQVP